MMKPYKNLTNSQRSWQIRFRITKGMRSIHWLLFCSISNVSSIINILEIGTYDGETTQLLSKIFPNSSIATIDLPLMILYFLPVIREPILKKPENLRKNKNQTYLIQE